MATMPDLGRIPTLEGRMAALNAYRDTLPKQKIAGWEYITPNESTFRYGPSAAGLQFDPTTSQWGKKTMVDAENPSAESMYSDYFKTFKPQKWSQKSGGMAGKNMAYINRLRGSVY